MERICNVRYIKKLKRNSILVIQIDSKEYNFKVNNNLLPYVDNILASLAILKSLEIVSGKKIKYEFAPKREGDLPVTIANNNLAKEVLNWSPGKSLLEMCNDGWRWYCDNPIV